MYLCNFSSLKFREEDAAVTQFLRAVVDFLPAALGIARSVLQRVAAADLVSGVVQHVLAVVLDGCSCLQRAATAAISEDVVRRITAALRVVRPGLQVTIAAGLQQTVVGDASTASGVVRPSEPVAVAADLVAVVDVWCGAAAGHARCQLVDGDAVLGQVAADVGAGPSDVGRDLLTVAGGEGCLAVQPTPAADLRHRIVSSGSTTLRVGRAILRVDLQDIILHIDN